MLEGEYVEYENTKSCWQKTHTQNASKRLTAVRSFKQGKFDAAFCCFDAQESYGTDIISTENYNLLTTITGCEARLGGVRD
jgi:hypothetical protein